MSKKIYYWPFKLGVLILWLQNFSTKIAAYAATLGYSPVKITEIQGKIADVVTSINNAETKAAESKAANAERDEKIHALKATLTGEVKTSKANPAATQEILEGLQVVGTDDNFNPLTFQTTLTYVLFMGYVQLNFVKAGFLGVNIYTRLKGQANWTWLALDTESPYMDTRPLSVAGVPETREYIAYGYLHDTQMPVASKILPVVFPG